MSLPTPPSRRELGSRHEDSFLNFACLVVVATYLICCDLKSISTDEGIRLWIINGGQPFDLSEPQRIGTWSDVLQTLSPYAYQPLYFLIQNTIARVAESNNVFLFRVFNIFLLWLSLRGLLQLSKGWAALPRFFLVGLFSFNAYLFMHVLQIREYTAGVCFYVWSTQLVLQLASRPSFCRPHDKLEYAAYGLLLTIGFYTQSWIVFPAIGQFLYLAAKRWRDGWSIVRRVAITYSIVFACCAPYLLNHPSKIDVGRWGAESSNPWPLLSDGIHLVVSGHLSQTGGLATVLSWLWPGLIVVAVLFALSQRRTQRTAQEATPLIHQAALMCCCIGVTVVFQLGYFYGRENLSLWPRYFVVHYFFFTYLVSIAFKHLDDYSQDRSTNRFLRSASMAIKVAAFIFMLVSSAYQTRSFYLNPYLDTGLSRTYSWRTLGAAIGENARAGDAVLFSDHVVRATMTYAYPLRPPAFLLSDLGSAPLDQFQSIVYIEQAALRPSREAVLAQAMSRGFCLFQEVPIMESGGNAVLTDWRIIVFRRDQQQACERLMR